MPKQDPSAARRLLVAQVRDLATGVGLAIRTARALNLPVEPAWPRPTTSSSSWRTCWRTWCRRRRPDANGPVTSGGAVVLSRL